MSGAPPARPAPGNPAGISKVQEVQLQVEEASNVMRDNVSQMLSNYEKAEVLEDKAGARAGAVAGFRLVRAPEGGSTRVLVSRGLAAPVCQAPGPHR